MPRLPPSHDTHTRLVLTAPQAKYKGIPFVSQKAIYKEVIQNLALREYASDYFSRQQRAAVAAAAAQAQSAAAVANSIHVILNAADGERSDPSAQSKACPEPVERDPCLTNNAGSCRTLGP